MSESEQMSFANFDSGARYARQVALEEIGTAGQQRLSQANVLVVGAGGLGCAVLPYLSAAGVGSIVVIDHDRIEESNLHRQPLYRTADVGNLKAQKACEAMLALNPHIRSEPVCDRLTPRNAPRYVADADIVVDCADSFAVTYVLSDECARSNKPLISASVIGLTGYVGAFCGRAPSYRAVFPELPMRAATCAAAGVLGTAVGVIGTLQAQLVLAMLVGMSPDVSGRMITVDFRTLRFSGFSFTSAPEPGSGFHFIDAQDVTADDLTVDLRGVDEAPVTAFPESVRTNADHVADAVTPRTSSHQRIVLCCRTGLRAWRAASKLKAAGHDNLALLALGD